MNAETKYPKLLEEGRVLVKLVAGTEHVLTAEECKEKLIHLQLALALLDIDKTLNYPVQLIASDSLSYLINGEIDDSCKAIISRTHGLDVTDWQRSHHPVNIESVRRCRLLLESSPEIEAKFHLMADVSVKWAAVVKGWPDICAAMDNECPNWRKTLWKDGVWQGQNARSVLRGLI